MSDDFPMPLVHPFATVEDGYNYFHYHMQMGRNKHVFKGRMMAFVIPPIGHDSHDDDRKEVYLNLIPE